MKYKGKVIKDFNIHIAEFLKRTAWTTPYTRWFKNWTIDEPIVALHPGGGIYWLFQLLNNIQFRDWVYTYFSKNRFQHLGNGFSVEKGPGRNTT